MPNPVSSPIVGLHGISRGTRIRKKALPKKKPVRLNYTEELSQTVPHKPNHRTEAKWVYSLARLLCYVDDGFNLSRINYENSYGFPVNGQKHRVKHAIQAQNVFRHIVKNAEEIGMKVNTAKTTLVCFSDSLTYKADAYIEDADGGVIRGGQKMKTLGLRLSSNPDWHECIHAHHEIL